MRIVQISDLHFNHLTWNPLRLLSKRILGNLNWLFSRKSVFFYEQLSPLPALFSELSVDLILFGGDFTTTALIEEYEKAAQFVANFSQPWIAIPGNHDHYTYRSWRQKHFYRFFTNQKPPVISHPVDFFNLKDHGIETHSIAPGWWLIALDTAKATTPYSSKGFFTEQHNAYMREILSLLPPGDSIICLNHYPFFPQDELRRNLEGGDRLQTLLQQSPQIRLYLHGHTHRHAIADLRPNQLPIILDSGCAVQGNAGTWNLIDLLPNHCDITAYQWQGCWKPFRSEKMSWNNK